jgi:hypothetical protein
MTEPPRGPNAAEQADSDLVDQAYDMIAKGCIDPQFASLCIMRNLVNTFRVFGYSYEQLNALFVYTSGSLEKREQAEAAAQTLLTVPPQGSA